MPRLAKDGTLVGLLRFSPFLFACAATNQVNLAFRTTVIEDTHLTLAVVPFEVGVNNYLIFFVIINIREKICRVSVPLQFIITSRFFLAGSCLHLLEVTVHNNMVLYSCSGWKPDL